MNIEGTAVTAPDISSIQEEQAEQILASKTRWVVWIVSGIVLFIVYGCFFYIGCQGPRQVDLTPSPELLGQVFMETTATNESYIVYGTINILAGVSFGTVHNNSLDEKEKVETLYPMLGSAIPNIMQLEQQNLCTIILKMASDTAPTELGKVPSELNKKIAYLLVEGNSLTNTQVVNYISSMGMQYLQDASDANVDGQNMFKNVVGIYGFAFSLTVGMDNIGNAMPKFHRNIESAILLREKPRFSYVIYLSLGPVIISNIILLMYLYPVVKFQHHFVVRKRGKYYLYQVFSSSFLVILAHVFQAYFFAFQEPDSILESRSARNAWGFVALETTVFTANLFWFALVQRLDMMYQAFIRGKKMQARRLTPNSYFRLIWLYFLCCTISTIPAIVWFFINQDNDTLRTRMHYLTVGMYVNFFIYLGLITFYIFRLLHEDGSRRFLDLKETLRHLIFQIIGFTACIIAVTVDVALHTPIFVILTYFWAYSISWFAVDAFSLPMWLFLRDKVGFRFRSRSSPHIFHTDVEDMTIIPKASPPKAVWKNIHNWSLKPLSKSTKGDPSTQSATSIEI